jgi:hypothetical protein
VYNLFFLKRLPQLLLLLFFFIDSYAQAPALDSLPRVSKNPLVHNQWGVDTNIALTSTIFVSQVLAHHPYFGFNTKQVNRISASIKYPKGKETIFYAVILLCIILGVLSQLFPKYMSDLFRLFFKTTLKQKQVREQLLQTPAPSLALNIFFIISAAFYITFVLHHYHIVAQMDIWTTMCYTAIVLAAIYIIKYLSIVFCGWLFGLKGAANAYIFVVFVINKMVGIFLLPFIFLLAFSTGTTLSTGILLSGCALAGVYVYRIILTWSALRGRIKANPFHFFLYLLAFEIAPLLVIYKSLLLYFS